MIQYTHFHPDHIDIEGARSRAIGFFELTGNSDRRYSDTAIQQIADSVYIVEAATPVRYDPDSEVKVGGTSGVAVVLPSREILLAVNPECRRQAIGLNLYSALSAESPHTDNHFVVSTHNIPAQRFLLAVGLIPTALDLRGSITYGSNA